MSGDIGMCGFSGCMEHHPGAKHHPDRPMTAPTADEQAGAADEWESRARAAEAKVAAVEALAAEWERGYNSPTASSWAKVHADRLRAALGADASGGGEGEG